ncbi:FkbM family methyltransferase [Parvibium lacunae]|nr:FkbM family methyltransferase [Parvibium lacunae]
MYLLKRVLTKIQNIFKREILRDPFLLEIKKWFRVDGDKTYRMEYPLNNSSVILDIGGYVGDFAKEMYERYQSTVYIFEPMPHYYDHCVIRFRQIKNIICLNYGLSGANQICTFTDSADATSFYKKNINSREISATLRDVNEVFKELKLDKIDLLKINIEGGEYDVLPAIIESGYIKNIRFLQIQFHNFIDNAETKRTQIREKLSITHQESWNFPFVWESWELKAHANSEPN